MVEIYDEVKKKTIDVNKRLADALLKNKKAKYSVKPAQEYQTKIMIAGDAPVKNKPGRPPKKKKDVADDEAV